MKSLYDGEKYTKEGILMSLETNEILKPIFKKYSDKGYSYREISHVIIAEVYSLECLSILTKAVEERKKL